MKVAGESFAARLERAVRSKKSPVLLGMDPRLEQIPANCFPGGRRDAQQAGAAFSTFARRIIDAVAPRVAAIKPQIAFYEAHGLPGLQAYQDTIRYATQKDLLVIGDIKRGDIGSTSEAYAEAHLGTSGHAGPFEVDAVTFNPWMGGDSLAPFTERIKTRHKGVYILLHTSNPGSQDLQEQTLTGGQKVFVQLAALIRQWQDACDAGQPMSSIGVVAGATYPEQLQEIQTLLPRAPLLIPGYGSQGGRGADVAFLFKGGLGPHLVNASRSILYAYEKYGCDLESGAIRAVDEMLADLGC